MKEKRSNKKLKNLNNKQRQLTKNKADTREKAYKTNQLT